MTAGSGFQPLPPGTNCVVTTGQGYYISAEQLLYWFDVQAATGGVER